MANLKRGSSGSEVKKLQTELKGLGYDLGSTGVDGKYGPKTEAAVKQYQIDNSHKVDGIAGPETLGSLYVAETPQTTSTGTGTPKASTGSGTGAKTDTSVGEPSAPTAPITSPGGFTYGDFQYDPYAKSDIVLEAESLLQQWTANKPGDYTPVWQDEADAYLNQYQNRDPFSYDFNSDALYNQYKDQYIQQGQMAMMDTMGQAAAMTGGYGNSYAQTVGQQAYNQQLSQLNNIMPELYQMAYDRYGKEGQEMLDMYNLYMNREAMEYGKHQDTVDNWYREMSRLTDNANTLYERDYDDYLLGYNTSLNEYNTSRSEAFTSGENQKGRDFTASENQKSRDESNKANAKSDLINLITATGYEPTASELEAAGMSREQAKSYKDAYTNSQTSTGGNTGGTQYKDIDVGGTVYNTINTEVKRVTTLDQLQSLVTRYLSLGYNPDQIEQLTIGKYNELMPKAPPKGNTGTVSGNYGGGGGGRYMTAVK